ncbi:MAG: HYR domain-containing protein [Saprospiraceae bacterium]|nr:HYR domain-containing protein [Saprospiraceae bacterium]
MMPGDCKDTLSITITAPAALEASNVAVGASCFGLSDGRATVNIFGGTGTYTYRWSSNVSTSNTANNLRAGNYIVTATDTKGCTITQNIVVTQPVEIVTTTTALGAGCSGRTPSSIIAKAAGGKAPFTYRWSNGSTIDTLKNPPTGNYVLIVSDSLRCQDTITVIVNSDSIPLQLRIEKTDLACDSESGGTARVIATGGGGLTYNYLWSNNAITPQITGLSRGAYEVTVTDDTGCRDSIKVDIANLGKFEANISNTAVSCPGAADGTITVIPNRGAPSDYQYEWSNTSGSSFLTRLSGGTYTVTITETASNCVVIASTNIIEADSIKIEIERVQNLDCNGDNDGSIDITATGGQGSLNYRWSNGALVSDLTSVGGGLYTLTVTDGNNCRETLEVNITEPEPLAVTIAVVNETGISNGRVTANVTGGTSGYNYIWLNSAGQAVGNQQTVSNLRAGVYTVQVTDRNGCNIQRSAAIQAQGCTGTFEITLTAKPTACDGTGGEISTQVTGGNAPYSYRWSTPNRDTTANVENLASGEYTVTVLDSGGCPKLESVVVSNPGSFAISFSSRREIACAGAFTGGVTATPNGRGPFKYQWSSGDTTRLIENKPAGEYTVTVTNGSGCVTSRSIEIEQPDTLFAKITARTNVTCFGANNGTTAVIAEGGSSPYSYRWSSNTNNATGTNLSNLAAGIYLVTATDINNCTTSTSVTITEPTQLDAGALATSVSCAGVENGSATLFVSGGTAPYSYIWSNNRTDSAEINLPAGAYTITVTDVQNCKDTVSVTVESPQELTINLTSTNERTPNANDGTAQAIPSGGTPPYQYRWDNTTTQQIATGLAPGLRSVTITDSKGCSKVGSVRINEASCIIGVQVTGTNIDCNGATSGRATAQVSNGGNETLSYVWSNNQTGATISGLRAGIYTVTVEQANTSCSANASITITEPSPITSSITNKTDIGCSGGMGSATVTASGGTGTLSYIWSTGASTATANNLTVGANSVTITDRNGCQKVETVTINQASGISLQVGTVTNVACAGASSGTATVNVTGGSGSYTYAWSNNVNSTTATANQLAAGTYTVTVNDGDGCESTTQVTITQPAPLAATARVNSNVTCRGESNGNAVVNVTGGTAGYTYQWSTNATTAQAENLPAGQHTITITDANNCTTTSSVTITQPETLQVVINSSNESVAGGNDGEARADPRGGTRPYRYSWSVPNATAQMISNLSPGNYTVTITDANGCTVTASTVIQQGGSNCAPFNILVADFPTTCATTTDGRAEVTNVTGAAPYQYRWSNGDTTASADSLAAGTYTVTVTGSDGCPSQQTVTITNPIALDFSVKTENEECEQAKNGAAIIEATGGTTPYSFMWQDGIGGNLRDTLASGNYTVTITDANQCKALATFTITVNEDRVPPVAVAKNITVYIDAFGQAEINVNDIDNGSTDNCDLASVSLSKRIFTCDDLGVNNILLIASDRSGNKDSIAAAVTVADTIKPFLDCQQDDILITNCEADRTITFSLPQAFDNCGAPLTPTLMEGLPSGSVFPPGITEQVFMVEDPAGNQAVCSFQVNIQVLNVAIEQDAPSCFNFAMVV